jgi:AcrR family transcriptional regulator
VESVTGELRASSTTLQSVARPRSEEARQAALTATVDLMLDSGVESVTFDDVAARSGVAKTTLYRHFGSKQAMVVEAAGSCFETVPTPDTGDLLQDLSILFDQKRHSASHRQLTELFPMLIAAGDRDPELRALLQRQHEERRRPTRTVLQLAQLRGEISRDLDLEVAVSMVLGPFTIRKLIDRQEVTDEFAERVLREVVAVLRATALAEAALPTR